MASIAADGPRPLDRVEAELGLIAGAVDRTPAERAARLLALGEEALEVWVGARGETPTRDEKEGFRLLALHRQGAKGEPSFNACRETCRELVYHFNLVTSAPDHRDAGRRLAMMAMVARHLTLFIAAKLEVAGLGEFCCSSRPLREQEEGSRQ